MSVEQSIKNIRTEQGVSQEALAELLDVSRQTVSKWETGQVRPSADHLARLSQALGVPVDALVKDDWVPPEEKPPEVQFVEVPVEVPVPVEIPAPRPRNYRLWAAIAAVLIAVGITVGALLFREPAEDFVNISEIDSGVIDDSTIYMPLLPLD